MPSEQPGRVDQPTRAPAQPAQPAPTRRERLGRERSAAPRSRPPERRTRRGRPEDPREAAVYEALAINEQVLDEVWFSSTVDIFGVVAKIAANALDAYEDDPAAYAEWVAVHRSGQCDCH